MTMDELRAALELTRRIERLQGRLSDIRATGGVGTSGLSERVLGGAGALFPGQVLAEQDALVGELIGDLEKERIIIRRYLERADLDGTEQLIMIRRYADCLPWKMVYGIVGYSPTQVHRYHQQALKKLGL